ncbi:uncharacterized protein LOC113855321 [Abrus precatorius]|uniref:Uncharacterized protein LOC113855321 n=1 Tax=Abrus precatorius TaxID=3816 RepID=A0A8B8KFX8_ABRPR|nr:uncharacterized protein LOC113855321 [Abrus precatorius]
MQVRSTNNISLGSRIRIPPITFTDEDFQGVDLVQDDPMVISVDILNCTVRKTLIDQGKEELKEYREPLVSFSGERVETRGCIDLYTSFGSEHEGKRIKVTYLVVHANTLYNILLDRPSLNKLKASARECYFASLHIKPLQEYGQDVNIVTPRYGEDLDIELDLRTDEGCRVEPNENMPGIDPTFLCHHLSVYKAAKSIAQKKRKVGGERAKTVKEETAKLLQAGFIREVRYSTYLVGQYSHGQKGKWQMANVYRLHRSKQSMSKICLPSQALTP